MILAQYTIRSKQDYIYKTNRIVEIMGASENISRSWDILFEQAEKCGLKIKRADNEDDFNFDNIKKAFDERTLDMVELFIGGGNDTVLFREKGEEEEEEPYIRANRAFSYYLIKNYPGMIPMAVGQNVSGNYQNDYRNLMKKADEEKNRMVSGTDTFILPFSLMDRDTFLPMAESNNGERYSRESLSKRIVGIECRNNDKAVRLLDDMVTKRGDESLLAVVHADGNNMGSKIRLLLGNNTDYDFCVKAMRKFTADTAAAFTTNGLKAMEDCKESLIKKYKDEKKYKKADGKTKEHMFAFRKVIADGDDMTFICNARFAMEYTQAYIKAVQNYESMQNPSWKYSSCAGMCIFHSHYSFANAYKLAEKACDDGAKSKVHKVGENGNPIPVEEGWVDFHYIHSSVGGDLMTIRRRQGTIAKMARPWCLTNGDMEYSYERMIDLAEIFRNYNVTRTDIKALGVDWENSNELGYKSLKRVYGHHRGLENEIKVKLKWNDEQLMRAVYDLSEIYDLWFAEV